MSTKKLRITVSGKSYDVQVEVLDESGVQMPVVAARPAAAPAAAAAPQKPAFATGPGMLTAPLAGIVMSIDCKVGDAVQPGMKVLTLEAMKMQTSINAESAGTIQEILVKPSDTVREGQPLVRIG